MGSAYVASVRLRQTGAAAHGGAVGCGLVGAAAAACAGSLLEPPAAWYWELRPGSGCTSRGGVAAC